MATDNSTPEIPTRTCTKCGETFPATREYFYKNRGTLYRYCKPCYQKLFRTYNISKPIYNPAKRRQAEEQRAAKQGRVLGPPPPVYPVRTDGLRECPICHRVLPATTEFFYTSPSNRDNLNRQCKECITKRDQE